METALVEVAPASATIKVEKPPYDPDKIEGYRHGDEVYFKGSTWAVNPKVTKASFSKFFAKNPRMAMRDFACIAPNAVEAYSKDPTLVDRRANPKLQSPFKEDGSFQSWFLPGPHLYYFHGDLGTTRDAAGFCMSHFDRVQNKVVLDMMLQIVPEPGKQLQFERFRQLVLELRTRGFEFAKVTFDSWQSFDTMQALTNKGLNVSWHSVDKDTKSYDTLFELLLSDRLVFYPHPVFSYEFSHLLLIDGKKVDHPENGSKDLCDAIAAVCYHAVEQAYREPNVAAMMMAPLSSSAQNLDVQTFKEVSGRLIRQVAPPALPRSEDDTIYAPSAVEFLSL